MERKLGSWEDGKIGEFVLAKTIGYDYVRFRYSANTPITNTPGRHEKWI